MKIDHRSWDKVADNEDFHGEDNPLWDYKRRELTHLIKKWGGTYLQKGNILKTDLIEEAIRPDHTLFWLAENNHRVFGMDISPRLTIYAKMRSEVRKSGIHFVACDIRDISFKDDSFDLIISNSTCDHFPQIDTALEELHRILKPKGRLIITIHNKLELTLNLFISLKKIFKAMPELHFECCYTPWNFKKMLQRAGFTVEDSTTNLHIPMGLWLLLGVFLNEVKKERARRFIFGLIQKIISYLEKIEKRETVLNFISSVLIACKASKL